MKKKANRTITEVLIQSCLARIAPIKATISRFLLESYKAFWASPFDRGIIVIPVVITIS